MFGSKTIFAEIAFSSAILSMRVKVGTSREEVIDIEEVHRKIFVNDGTRMSQSFKETVLKS